MESLYQETRDLHRQNILRWLESWTDRVDMTPSLITYSVIFQDLCVLSKQMYLYS